LYLHGAYFSPCLISGVINSWAPLPEGSFPRPPPPEPTKRPPSTKKPLHPEHPDHQPTPKPAPKPRPEKPDTCDTSYDAITVFRNTEIWIFKDKVSEKSLKTAENALFIVQICHKIYKNINKNCFYELLTVMITPFIFNKRG
jgi:hypothetical protein